MEMDSLLSFQVRVFGTATLHYRYQLIWDLFHIHRSQPRNSGYSRKQNGGGIQPGGCVGNESQHFGDIVNTRRVLLTSQLVSAVWRDFRAQCKTYLQGTPIATRHPLLTRMSSLSDTSFMPQHQLCPTVGPN